MSLVLILVQGLLSGCSDDSEGKAPGVIDLDESTLLECGWKWALCLDNGARLYGSPDVRQRGYVVQMDDWDGYDAVFVLDDQCRVSEACVGSTWYYFFTQGSTLHVSYNDGAWVHKSYDAPSTGRAGGTSRALDASFGQVASALKAVFDTVDVLPRPAFIRLDDLFAAVERGTYDTSSVAVDDEAVLHFCADVSYYEFNVPTLRDDLFGTGMFLHYSHERTGDYNRVGIMADPVEGMTFNRGSGTGNYGDEMENKVYCGLLFSTSPRPTLYTSEFRSALVPVEPVDKYVWVDVPEGLEEKPYYICAFMVSEQEKAQVERGGYVAPHLVRYEEESAYQPLFYGGEAQLSGITVTNQPIVNGQLTVNLSGEFSLPDGLSGVLQQGFTLKARRLGGKSYSFLGNVPEAGQFDLQMQVDKRDFKEMDKERFVARGDWELAVYAGWVCIGVAPFTVVYDEKPSIRYADLVQNGGEVTYKEIWKGAFWFEDDVRTYWETATGPVEASAGLRNDKESLRTEVVDDSGKISHNLKTTGAYMQTIVNGKVLRSNRLTHVRGSDGKRVAIRMTD